MSAGIGIGHTNIEEGKGVIGLFLQFQFKQPQIPLKLTCPALWGLILIKMDRKNVSPLLRDAANRGQDLLVDSAFKAELRSISKPIFT